MYHINYNFFTYYIFITSSNFQTFFTLVPQFTFTRMSRTTTLFILFLHVIINILGVCAKVSSIIVFGDSSVDSGNNNQISTVLKSNFKPYGRDFDGGQPTGRFSNGRIATDFISDAFWIKQTVPAYLDPAYNISDFATGVSFASAGTGYDKDTSNVLSVIPLWKELEYFKEYQDRLKVYLGQEKAENALGEALYIVSAGTNDFLENYYALPGRSAEYSIDNYQNFLVGLARDFITEIYKMGARKISIGGLPPMGCLPLERARFGSFCIEEYNNVALSFNQKLKDMVSKMNEDTNGIRLVLSNPYDILSEIIHTPHSFGFQNAVTACCATGMYEMSYMCNIYNPFTCTDANTYVFWDSFHTTEKANAIVAQHAVKNSLAQFFYD